MRGAVERKMATFDLVAQPLAQSLVGGDPARQANGLDIRPLERRYGFDHQRIDHRLLETGGNIGQLALALRRRQPTHIIQHGGL